MTQETFRGDTRNAYGNLAYAIIQATGPGTITITAKSAGSRMAPDCDGHRGHIRSLLRHLRLALLHQMDAALDAREFGRGAREADSPTAVLRAESKSQSPLRDLRGTLAGCVQNDAWFQSSCSRSDVED